MITLDFGTTLAGRVTDDRFPYARTIGSFAGLAGAIPDALVRGTRLVDNITGNILDLKIPKKFSSPPYSGEWVRRITENLRIG